MKRIAFVDIISAFAVCLIGFTTLIILTIGSDIESHQKPYYQTVGLMSFWLSLAFVSVAVAAVMEEDSTRRHNYEGTMALTLLGGLVASSLIPDSPLFKTVIIVMVGAGICFWIGKRKLGGYVPGAARGIFVALVSVPLSMWVLHFHMTVEGAAVAGLILFAGWITGRYLVLRANTKNVQEGIQTIVSNLETSSASDVTSGA